MSQSNMQQTSQGQHFFAAALALPVRLWRQLTLLIVFALLLVVVVICCTGTFSPFFSIALVGALAVAVFAFIYPQFALFLIFLAAGFPSLLIPLPGHTMRPIEGALFLALAVAIVRRPAFRFTLSHLLMFLFVIIALISFIHVPALSTGLNSYGADKRLYSEFLLLIAFLCGTFLVGYVKNIATFLPLVLLCNLPFCVIGLLQWGGIHLPSLFMPSTAIEVLQEGRLSGASDSPTTFAFYLLNIFALSLACWLLGTRRRDRMLGIVMLLLSALNVVGSGTRSATAVILLLIVVALLLNRRIRLLLFMLVLAGILSAFFFDAVLGKFLHDPTSTSNRFFLWGQALLIIKSNPWLGIGLEQFPVYYARLVVSQAAHLNSAGISVHNQYLELGLESGIPWLLVGVSLLVSILVACWKVYGLAQRKYQLVLLAAICVALSNLAICFVDVPLDKPEGGVFLFVLAGLALGYVDLIRRGKSIAIPATPSQRAFVRPPTPSQSAFVRPQTPTISATGIGSGLYHQRSLLPPDRLRGDQTTTLLEIVLAGHEEAAPSAKKSTFAVIIQLISWGIAIPIIFPTTALLTHYLQPIQYGEYSYTLPFLAICALFTFTGMDPLLIRQLSRQKRSTWRSTLSQTLGTRLVTTICVSLIAAGVALILPVSAEQRVLLLLGIGTLIFSYSFNCVRSVCENGFIAEQRVVSIALLTTINRVLTAVLIFVAVFAHLSLVQIYILIAYSDLPSFLVLVFLARRRFKISLRISLAHIRATLRKSLSLTGHDALALLSGQADILLLLPLAGPLSVGIYALAMRITDPLINVAFAYVHGIFPFLCTKFEQGRAEFALLYRDATRIMALAIIPLAIFVSIEAPALIGLLGGAHFTAAIPVTRILMWSIATAFFGNLALQTCMASNQEKRIPYATAFSLSTNILANLLLIPLLQTTGAAIAALLCELVSLCLFSFLLIHYVYLSSVIGVMFRVLLGNVPGLAFLLWQQHLPIFYLIPIFCLLTLVSCSLTGAISLKDFQMARQLFTARRAKRQVSSSQ